MLPILISTLSAVASTGTASTPPPPAPVVDWSAHPDSAVAQADQPDGTKHPVRARLVADRSPIVPGETFRLGLHLDQEDGWHTYWTSPGEIGMPTNIKWGLPDGYTTTPYAFPAPQRFEQSEIVSFGYDDQVLFFTEVTVPASASGALTVTADADWLVCQSSCIPGGASLSLPLELSSTSKPTAAAPLFDHYAGQHPTDPKSAGYDVAVTIEPTEVLPNQPFTATFKVSGAKGVEAANGTFAFAPIVGDGWMINEQSVDQKDDSLVVVLKAETFLDEAPESDRIGALFQLKGEDGPVPVQFQQELPWSKSAAAAATPVAPAEPSTGNPANLAVAAAPPSGNSAGLLSSLFFAFFGGLILNIMPCVLPVLTLKLYSLVEQTDITPAEQRTAGLAYTGGILVSFLALAATVLAFRGLAGSSVGWGFQFQYPPYVAVLATLVFAFGLSLFGVFEIPAFGSNAAGEASSKEGPVGYFFTGVFATLLATPCSAPILGSATAFTLSASTPEVFAVYSLIGLGLASPFLLIAFVPSLYRFLPSPGPWMESFKHILGFTLMLTTLWLLGVLGAQIGLNRLISFLFFMGFVSFGCWIFGHFGGVAATLQRQMTSALVGLVVAGIGGYLYVDLAFADPTCDTGETVTSANLDFEHEIPWQDFSEERIASLKGSPIFIDFTAEWCLTCKANEKLVLETSGVRDAMKAHGIVPLKADWTTRDETITAWLQRYGKAGVPFYLVLGEDGTPIPLGETITPGQVTDAFAQAKGG